MTRTAILTAVLFLPLAAPASAQAPLTLTEAISRARRENPEVRQADARVARAAGQSRETRAGLLPRVDVSEGWQRSDLPVFAFSSLLSQRRFSADDFDVARLNNPNPVNNFRSAVVLEQPVFDATLRAAMTGARLGREMAKVEREHVGRLVAVATVEAYGRVHLIEAMAAAARAAVEAAEQDLKRATDRRDAGLATDADVLMVTVHLSAAKERQVQAEADVEIARAQLNYLMGESLDTRFELAAVDAPADSTRLTTDEETSAIAGRADVRLAMSAERLAEAGVSQARAAFLPQVVARGAAEWNGATFGERTSGWMVGAEVRLNVFRGLADRARLAQARATADERRVEREAALGRARLDVRAASASLAAARARVDLSRAAVAAARESQRITRDRYDNGLAAITDVLRASQAVLDAEAQAVAADSDRATGHARLEAALGRL
ncbi:MAG: TolC family protein [Acidobacteria bacterium]|nr:TolC family protein [Acidobacteriota bacterium]